MFSGKTKANGNHYLCKSYHLLLILSLFQGEISFLVHQFHDTRKAVK